MANLWKSWCFILPIQAWYQLTDAGRMDALADQGVANEESCFRVRAIVGASSNCVTTRTSDVNIVIALFYVP